MNKVCGVVEYRGLGGEAPEEGVAKDRTSGLKRGEDFPLLKHTSKILPAAARAASAKSSVTASEAAA